MPDKTENLIAIKQDYYTDLLFAEGKITYDEFIKRRTTGPDGEWKEMKYVGEKPFFLNAFLFRLTVENRLRAIKDLYGYDFEYIKIISEFGGSISNHFMFQRKLKDDRLFNKTKARLAITLDIPVVFLIRDSPTFAERCKYNNMEYEELGERVSFEGLRKNISRPTTKRSILPFIIENRNNTLDIFEGLYNGLVCRVDLQKTFYVIEFYLQSFVDVGFETIQRLITYFDINVYRVIVSDALLRDTKKISLIGTYVKAQQMDANIFSNDLIIKWNGQQLYPIDMEF